MSDLETLWSSLLDGDPGPSLSFVDSLLNNDLPFAAGGVLRDLAERMVHASNAIDDEQQRAKLVEAINQVLTLAYSGDKAGLEELLDEVT